jgi:hypothetical protein
MAADLKFLDFDRDESLARAACGDFSMIVARLRARGDPESTMAADFITGVRKRPANRPRKNDERDMIVARLRAHGARELDFAADIIEGKRKAPPNRPRKNFERDLEIYRFVEDCIFGSNGADGISKDAAVAAAVEKFILDKGSIYGILKEMKAARDGEPKPRRRRTKRLTQLETVGRNGATDVSKTEVNKNN